MKIFTIYCHTHIESGRRYIGLTSQTMEQRWKTHVSVSKGSKGGRWHFPNAIRKYGPRAFSHEVLAMSCTLEDANWVEEHLIEREKTRDPLKGFNLARGGSHTPHPIRKNPWDDPLYRAKSTAMLIARSNTPQARAANKAALNTPESRAKRSKISSEIHARLETKEKISRAAKGRVRTQEERDRAADISRGKTASIETKQKISALSKALWADPTYRKLTTENRRKVKSKPRPNFDLKGRKPENNSPFVCKIHGNLLEHQRYMSFYKDGSVRFQCKECVKKRNALRYHIGV